MTLSREQRSRRPIYTQTINKLNSNRGGTHRTEQVKGVVVVRGGPDPVPVLRARQVQTLFSYTRTSAAERRCCLQNCLSRYV